MVGKKRKDRAEPFETPVDLASRIGGAGAPEPAAAAAPEPVRRVDGPIEASPRVRPERPLMIGLEEVLAAPLVPPPPVIADPEPGAEAQAMEFAPLAATVRKAPAQGEMDLVVTPLPTPDDWHHFELALRRLPGVGTLRTEYYRAGILKLRVRWSGAARFAEALDRIPGYRVGILGEDRTTVQIRVGRA